jgi:hypothetical protein
LEEYLPFPHHLVRRRKDLIHTFAGIPQGIFIDQISLDDLRAQLFDIRRVLGETRQPADPMSGCQ